MKHSDIIELLRDFKKILDESSSKAEFSMNCVLNGRASLLTKKFQTFLFNLFTLSNLDRETMRIRSALMQDFMKIENFYHDEKILLKAD